MFFVRRAAEKPSFQSKRYIVTPSNSHEDMYIFTNRKTGRFKFAMHCSVKWLEDHFERVL